MLIHSTSPYLRQHASNPVRWYSWGAEAFQIAEKEDKPIFLSIGYSTCHWCHVMAEESFEDAEVAALLNETCVCIKVDREERPDVDHLYMSVCQLMTGSGGWPLTILMTPDKIPFFSGTYFPKYSRGGRVGVMDLIRSVHDAWLNRRAEILKAGQEILAHVADQRYPESENGVVTGYLTQIQRGYHRLVTDFDDVNGGFGRAPKFPTVHQLLFLFRFASTTGDKVALEMAESTLDAMRLGGIFDHIGLGFHRYATDADWHLPHFEKMLYDQAMLVIGYLEAYQLTQRPHYLSVAVEIVDYVMNRLKAHELPGFYCAEDADTDHQEGKTYLWTLSEVTAVLGQADGAWVADIFGITEDGNAPDEATGRKTGANVFHQRKSWTELACEQGRHEDDLLKRWADCRQRLRIQRERRRQPGIDTKLLADWNAMMLVALARLALISRLYTPSVVELAEWMWDVFFDHGNDIYHSFSDGQRLSVGFSSDAAYGVWGFILVHQLTLDPVYLDRAKRLFNLAKNRFWDGTAFCISVRSDELPLRQYDGVDSATPSANSVFYHVARQLSVLTFEPEYNEIADRLWGSMAEEIAKHPAAYGFWLAAACGETDKWVHLKLGKPNADEWRDGLGNEFLPFSVWSVDPEITDPGIRMVCGLDGCRPKGSK